MSSTRYALLVSSSMFGEMVDEVSVPSGRGVQIGNSPVLAAPVPKGAPYVCQVRWLTSSSVRVTDGRGDVHMLRPEQEMNIRIGPLDVTLMLNAHAPLLRVEAWSWKGSLGWLCVVLMVSMLNLKL